MTPPAIAIARCIKLKYFTAQSGSSAWLWFPQFFFAAIIEDLIARRKWPTVWELKSFQIIISKEKWFFTGHAKPATFPPNCMRRIRYSLTVWLKAFHKNSWWLPSRLSGPARGPLRLKAHRNWITDAENAPMMDLKEAKAKWTRKRKQLQNLSR